MYSVDVPFKAPQEMYNNFTPRGSKKHLYGARFLFGVATELAKVCQNAFSGWEAFGWFQKYDTRKAKC